MFQFTKPTRAWAAQPHVPRLEPAICSGFDEGKEGWADGTALQWEGKPALLILLCLLPFLPRKSWWSVWAKDCRSKTRKVILSIFSACIFNLWGEDSDQGWTVIFLRMYQNLISSCRRFGIDARQQESIRHKPRIFVQMVLKISLFKKWQIN